MENRSKKSIVLVVVGSMNALHGIFHFIQFIQSMMMVIQATHEHSDHETWFEKLMHNPILGVIWAVIGFWTLRIGIIDYKHHKRCKNKSKN